MKINTVHTYACEICGRTYFEEADALDCEKKCNQKKQENEARNKDEAAIEQAFYILKGMVKDYCNKYYKLPPILRFSPEELEEERDDEEKLADTDKSAKCECKCEEKTEPARKKPCEVTYTYKGTNPIEELLREFKIF